ncbi:uncharacterized protein MONBRDRAFT_30343 [Monosiga brevicollis MX1]|uniref:Uncharacterized protein n=1 Tax=Monosiga brevicollis TaxID=81824 RepID=A9VDP9_MONBE|nr:uncharacterized protein MONBRDRAFT_30343 [Monosiga brevicollis MX1]EDQ84340.1 predicted protein [Monosiga brevicollis MX1]|eukprot:XP_001750836.1 hypothetical protein [Monosiga brevicollis MX1]
MDLTTWLTSLKLEEYGALLEHHGITSIHQLSILTEEQLITMGMDKIGHRRRLLKNAKELMAPSVQPASTQAQPPVVPTKTKAPPPVPPKSRGPSTSTEQNDSDSAPPPLPRKAGSLRPTPALAQEEKKLQPRSKSPIMPPSRPPPPRDSAPVPVSAAATAPPAVPRKTRPSDSSTRGPALLPPSNRAAPPPSLHATPVPKPSRPPPPAESAPARPSPPSDPAPARPQREDSTRSTTSTTSGNASTPATPLSPKAPPPLPSPPPPGRPQPPKLPTRTSGPDVHRNEFAAPSDDDEGSYIMLPRLPSDASQLRRVSIGQRRESSLLPSSMTREQAAMLTERSAAAPRTLQKRSKVDSHATKEGWLLKRGGATGRKGWDRRYCVYKEGVLSYFVGDKETRPQGCIALTEMKAIRHDTGHKNRFELDTYERTFIFKAESPEEMTSWMMFLGSQIQLFKPKPTAGGSMADPDKEGYMRHACGAMGWARRYIALKDGQLCLYETYQDFKDENPVDRINTMLITVKVRSRSGRKARNHQFKLVDSQQRHIEFQAASDQELRDWTQAIQNSILWSLNQLDSAATSHKKQTKSVVDTIRPDEAMKIIRENTSNLRCADCSTANPDWASINLGTMVCIDCSGVHRSMGVHISKVRSATLDDWPRDSLEVMKALGVKLANTIWEGNLPEGVKPNMNSDRPTKEDFIRRKYEKHEFVKFWHDPARDINEQLCAAVQQSELLDTAMLLAAGADPKAQEANTGHSALYLARRAKRSLQAALLSLNGAVLSADEQQSLNASVQSASSTDGNVFGPGATDDDDEGEDVDFPAPTPTQFEGPLALFDSRSATLTPYDALYEMGVLRLSPQEASTTGAGTPEGAPTAMEIPLQSLKTAQATTAADILNSYGHGQAQSANNENLRSVLAAEHGYLCVTTLSSRRFVLQTETPEQARTWAECLQANIDAIPLGDRGFDFENCSFVGHLQIHQEGVGYKQRYFALQGKALSYFLSQTDPNQNEIDLSNFYDVVAGLASRGVDGKLETSKSRVDLTLVGVHDLVVLRANTEEVRDEWFRHLKATQVFGAELESSPTLVPRVVDMCCSFIETRGLFEEGIYRVPGNAATMRRLRQAFNMDDTSVKLDPAKVSATDVAGLLKQYFRQLPESLFPRALYDGFLDTMRIADHEQRLYNLKHYIEQLPPAHYQTLRRLCAHLAVVAEHAASNKMTTTNLAGVFAPSLMHVQTDNEAPPGDVALMAKEYKCLEACITYHEWLFNMEQKSDHDLMLKAGRLKIEAAKQAHEQALSTKKGTGNLAEFIFEIEDEIHDTSHTFPLSSETVASEVLATLCERQGSEVQPGLAVVEVVNELGLMRPLAAWESLFAASARWRGPFHFKIQNNPFDAILHSALGAQSPSTWLHIRSVDMETGNGIGRGSGFRRCYARIETTGADGPGSIVVFKDETLAQELGRFALDSAIRVYSLTRPRKLPTPFSFVLLRVTASAYHETVICADSQVELEQWFGHCTVLNQANLQ